jgi:acetyl-CoA C-acetyltransferase
MEEVVIAGAARTPIGSFNGSLSTIPATQLGQIVTQEVLQRAGVTPSDVDELIMGIVLSSDCGAGPARQVALHAGLPNETTAYAINQLCASGMRAVAEGFKSIRLGEGSVVVAGGMESMSCSPHAVQMRPGIKMGEARLQDTMLRDALIDPFHNYHMGNTAENVARKHGVEREHQDAFACSSQNKAEAAQRAGRFTAEIAPVTIASRKGDIVVDTDEYPKAGVTVEALAKLRPAFDRNGTVTAGNASGINDGAAAVVLLSGTEARRRGVEPLGRIVSWATCGVDPAFMGTGPIPASRTALKRAGWTVADLDLVEANEAFAAQAIVVNQSMEWDVERVNVNGGAIALGHPIGASGCRILVTLLYEMQRRGVKRGLATACVGGGMGIALCVEKN